MTHAHAHDMNQMITMPRLRIINSPTVKPTVPLEGLKPIEIQGTILHPHGTGLRCIRPSHIMYRQKELHLI